MNYQKYHTLQLNTSKTTTDPLEKTDIYKQIQQRTPQGSDRPTHIPHTDILKPVLRWDKSFSFTLLDHLS